MGLAPAPGWEEDTGAGQGESEVEILQGGAGPPTSHPFQVRPAFISAVDYDYSNKQSHTRI